jgi:LacI family transcriptional regulator
MKPKGPTMEMVARKAGVSITTVSHVINKTRQVNQETKDAVVQAIQELHYPWEKRAKSQNSAVCIGVILADAREDYYIDMIKSLESVAADYGVSLIFCDSEANFEKEQQNVALLLDRKVQGLLVAPADADRMPKRLQKIVIPVVLIDRQYESHTFLAVGINNFRSSYRGTQRMFEKGCKKIGFIGYSDPVNTIRQRILGYKTAIIELATDRSPKVLFLKYNGGDAFPLIKRFIEEESFDGLVCATSSLCYELITVLDILDAEIQHKLQIISFDENRWLDYLKYPVLVISQPIGEISHAALENLLRMVDQKKTFPPVKRELLFETSIIDRIKQE